MRKKIRALTESTSKSGIMLSPSIIHYMENQDEPMGIKDTSSTFVYANKAYGNLLNLPADFSVEGKKDNDMPAPTAEFATLFQSHDRMVELSKKRRTSLEIHPFGKEQILSAYFFDKTAYFDDSGKVVGTLFHGKKAEHLSLRFYLCGHVRTGSLILTQPDAIFSEFGWLVAFHLRCHLSTKEIAAKLNVSVGYVKNTISELYRKAGVGNNKMFIEFLRSKGWHTYVPEQLLAGNHFILPR